MNIDIYTFVFTLLVPIVTTLIILSELWSRNYDTELNLIESKIDALDITCGNIKSDSYNIKEMLRVLLEENGMTDIMPQKCSCCQYEHIMSSDNMPITWYIYDVYDLQLPSGLKRECPYYKDWYPIKCKKFKVKE